jgi:NADPH:quinone reductase-like Zn-dependent oxidoreductase
MPENTALWLKKQSGPWEVGPAPYTSASPGEVVVRVRAVAMNPIDIMPGIARRLLLPWLTYPTVLGSDVAGEVVEVGPGETRLRVGDRVIGHAMGVAKDRTGAPEGAFQRYVVLLAHMTSPIPDDLSFERAAVLPLAMSTAATGLFQQDQLGLAMPTLGAPERGETVLVWGGSTSVGTNAIQLAHCAGYRVVTTASRRNFDYVSSLGAAGAVEYHARDVVAQLTAMIGDSPLAGALAIGAGSLGPTIELAARLAGAKKVAAAQPGLLVSLQQGRAQRKGVELSAIWGGSLKNNEVGRGIYVDFLPAALSSGTYRAAPGPLVVGDGLAQIPVGMKRLKAGVSAAKVVVST